MRDNGNDTFDSVIALSLSLSLTEGDEEIGNTKDSYINFFWTLGV